MTTLTVPRSSSGSTRGGRALDIALDRLRSPIGDLILAVDGAGCVRSLDFEDFESRTHRLLRRRYGDVAVREGRASSGVRDRIVAYFDGDFAGLDAIDCRTDGTPFQQRVWTELRRIPAGQTMSYGALAAAVGLPKASRAVGLANGSNPICIILPCHRVIGADGSLTGYGGGIERKRWLLAHEGIEITR